MSHINSPVLDPISASNEQLTATSADKLAYLCNVKRLSQWFYTGPRYILSQNITPAKWATIHHALRDGFITKYADPLCLLGTGFGANTSYTMFDIDRGSPYHPSNDPRAFERFLATLAKIGLTTPVIIQSSHSGGIHVYSFFDRDINTFRIASLTQVSLIDAKFEIKDGTLELFPNCKDYGNKSNHKPHRSPLQPNGGGSLLDRQGNPLMDGANLNHETQLAAFLQMAKASARSNDMDKILRKIEPVYEKFKGSPNKYQHTHRKDESEGAREWREDLEVLLSTGWTGFHQTNELIQRFIEYGVVFKKKDNAKDLFEWAFEAVTSANGYKQYCRHQHEIKLRISDWIDSTLKKGFYVPYVGYPTRSSERDNFIANHKHSKSVPTTKAEVYKRQRVESVSADLKETVETILATIVNMPTRIGDLINLIQTIAREKFGQAFSKNTLYKPHYKYIWMKLLGTKETSDIVLTTSVTLTNMEYCSETSTGTAFEGSTFNTTNLPKTNLKPFIGETWHSAPPVCSVSAAMSSPLANEVDPDPDPDPDLKKYIPLDPDPDPDLGLKDTSLDPTHSRPASSDLDTNPQSNLIEPPGVDSLATPTHDRDKLIESDPKARDLSLNPTHSQSPTDPGLIDRGANPRFNTIDTSGADSIIRSYPDQGQSIDPDSIHSQFSLISDSPNFDSSYQTNPIKSPGADSTIRFYPDQKLTVEYFKSLSLDQKLQLTEQQIREMSLSRFPLIEGCLVRPFDKYHVHGADRGIVTEIETWGVYVAWSDGTSGRYVLDDLICTYLPKKPIA